MAIGWASSHGRTRDGSTYRLHLTAAGTAVLVVTTLTVLLMSAVPPRLTSNSVRTVAAAGMPTLYTVDLSSNRTLQLYLDPGSPGFNGIHATFFDGQGREVPCSSATSIMVRRGADAVARLPVLQEGPGHFYSDFNFRPGDWRLEISATEQAGRVFRTHVVVHL